ncbi:histone deacetylase 9-like, partial [Mustelus asterias]
SLVPDPLPISSSASPAYEGLLFESGEVTVAYPLRKTASEPNLKLRLKLKQRATEKRRNALLRRKDSAPASLRRRPPESGDGSPSRSRSHSGPVSPNNTATCENGAGQNQVTNVPETTLAHQLLMQEGSLFRLAVPNLPSLPNISQGLPTSKVSWGNCRAG